ncbi:ergosterol biosynthesis ERG4/ERG24 family [Guillardia theta CCMP2712]|uniref:Delta(14)-sterol reductase n=1 Tax=Guillardia theta (strain CCMP2712) TaxID=905079 RepID=L1JTI5_GUITC|nr:ergosterol biosynthesis ERG4/ERG24 family [Guillardia theta CCMP2712]EKX51861.1 ergosterol biosynthesis ERG4/ERG24 family [Guillardia theta CCMP2712]|mmetsp:Transcript_41951/g.132260  ORF Transcript_41951/g.132260 Transcript_41951/m.132260 type:complete len:420 (-) Transcript_41951:86-1345(-)|eukprot:XP_005838841.1 ergosterol biosynthesis ERG4/ERG24 family [Guillardia theta CCMP2712]
MGKTTEYEFGGPIGTTINMIVLPLVVVFLYLACPNGESSGFCLRGVDVFQLKHMPIPGLSQLFSLDAFAMCAGWFLFLVFLERILPYKVGQGVELSNGQRLKYRINGHLTFWVSLFVAEHFIDLSILYDKYLELAVAAISLSILLSVYLYLSSFKKGALLAKGGNTGCAPYDFWMGRELNPRVGDFDLKVFCELRPGLIGWMLLNLGMLQKQRQLNNGSVSTSMLLVNAFQGLYVWDALYNEEAVLTTMDVTTDGFGYMLCFGDLAWVPFTYSLPARYLVTHNAGLSDEILLAFALLGMLGFYVFRASNSQKDAFRRDPQSEEVKHLKYLKTERGTSLIVSGWWGLARKINYTGDWFFGLSWSLFTGFGSILTYFYPIYFAALLAHRAWRDDHACSLKYGADWKKFKEMVPYVFFPWLF